MAFDSLGGGLARGIQTAMQFAGQRDLRETQARIAKLQGQLLEQQELARHKLDPMMQKAMQTPDTFGVGSDFNMPLTGADLANVPQTEGLHISKHRPGELTMPGVGDVGRKEGDVLKALTDAYAQNFGQFQQAGYDPTPLMGALQKQRQFENFPKLLAQLGVGDGQVDTPNLQLGADSPVRRPSLGLEVPQEAGVLNVDTGKVDGNLGQTDTVTGVIHFAAPGRTAVPTIDPIDRTIKLRVENNPTKVVQDMVVDNKPGSAVIDTRTGKVTSFYPTARFEKVTAEDGSVTLVDIHSQQPAQRTLTPGPRGTAVSSENVIKYRNGDMEPVPPHLRGATPKALNDAGYFIASKDQITSMDSAKEMKGLAQQARNLWLQATDPNSEIYARIEEGFKFEGDLVKDWSLPSFDTFRDANGELETTWENVFYSRWWKAFNDRMDVLYKTDEQMALYVDLYITSAVRIARASGEVGTMTEGDINRAMRKLPNPGIQLDEMGNIKLISATLRDTPAIAERKFQEMIQQSFNAGPLKTWRELFKGRTDQQQNGLSLEDIEAEMKRRGIK